MAYFANKDEVLDLLDNLPVNGYLVAAQTAADFTADTRSIKSEITRTTVIDLTKSIEEIYKDMDATSCRYRIRKAEKSANRIIISYNDITTQNDFLDLYNRFVQLSQHTYQMSQRSFDEHLQISDIFLLYFDHKPMCGHIMFRDMKTGRARLAYAASRRHEDKQTAQMVGPLNRYLCWHEIKHYKSTGYDIFDFGGIGRDPGIDAFKQSFGGTVLAEYEYNFAGALGRIGLCARDYAFEFRRKWSARKGHNDIVDN